MIDFRVNQHQNQQKLIYSRAPFTIKFDVFLKINSVVAISQPNLTGFFVIIFTVFIFPFFWIVFSRFRANSHLWCFSFLSRLPINYLVSVFFVHSPNSNTHRFHGWGENQVAWKYWHAKAAGTTNIDWSANFIRHNLKWFHLKFNHFFSIRFHIVCCDFFFYSLIIVAHEWWWWDTHFQWTNTWIAWVLRWHCH